MESDGWHAHPEGAAWVTSTGS